MAVNDAAVRCYGYDREAFLRMTIEQIRPHEDLEHFREHLNDNERSGGTVWRHLRSDGSVIDVEVETVAIQFDGEPCRIVTARNVTGLWMNIERLNLAMNAGKFAIWEYNIDDGSLKWDTTNSGAYGIDRALFPKSMPEFLNLVDPKYRDILEEALTNCVSNGIPYDCEFQLYMPGVGTRWRHAVGKRISDGRGKPIKIIGVEIDITDRKKMEEQLHRSQNLEAVGRLASGIAHDFNNLLTIISGYSHLLVAGMASDEASKAANEICSAAERATRLVRQLLDFSRTVPTDPKQVSMNKIVAETASMLRRLIPENILLKLASTSEAILITVDPGQIEQLIMNLCLNARDAMNEGGTLTIRLERHEQFAILTIVDTGSGMTPEVQERMFEPYFTTKEKGIGCGLGMSIVYGVVKQLQGSIEVQSSPGQGTTVTVKIPLSM